MCFRKFIGMGLLCLFLTPILHAQQLKLGTSNSSMIKSAVLELSADKQGLLLPRLTDTTSINTLSPPDGMMIYFTSLKRVLVRSNGYWMETPGLINGSLGIGTSSFDATNREKLLIDAGATSSYNLISGRGSINNYLQFNIQNQSSGDQASSDIVATANNGTETSNYINMGINSGGFNNSTYPMISGANTAYLYSTGNDFSIGNTTSGKYLRFFTGGYASTNERLTIDGNGNVGVATATPTAKLDAAGTYKLGAKGSVNKNTISFVYTVPSNITIPAGTSTGSGSVSVVVLGTYPITTTNTYTAGVYDMSVTLAAANQPTSTQATVTVSPAFDLPTNVSIAFSRATSTSAVKIRFQNNGTGTQSITAGQQFYITINEF
jgi:hypothetical protein